MSRGFSVLETLLSLLLLALALGAGWSLLASHREAADWTARRAEGLETVRTVAWILSEELAAGRPGLDWGSVSADSVALRAFRGSGMALSAAGAEDRLRVCYRGLRAPNPRKDSVLVLDALGRWWGVELEDRRRVASPCPGLGEGTEEVWTLSASVTGAVLGRIFERGSYHLADSAFRYRRGLGGRQPLTPGRIGEGGFLEGSESDGSLSWSLVLLGLPGAPELPPFSGSGG